jgi:hypothetical protein
MVGWQKGTATSAPVRPSLPLLHLRFLTLINCSRLTDAAAVHIGTHCPDLRTLHLLDIFSLYDKAVRKMPQQAGYVGTSLSNR